MGANRSPKQLQKFLSYILGRHPDEYGLVLGAEGYVKIKDLLKSVNEEDGWGYVRQSHLNEILLTLPSPDIEIKDNTIRAINRKNLQPPIQPESFPKILFTCVRNKAHGFVIDKGISPQGADHVILSSDPEMAQRIGRRKDARPILLSVHTGQSMEQGVEFQQVGESLYLSGYIPPGCFTAPPLPKQKPEHAKETKPVKKERDLTPGSFIMDFNSEKNSGKKFRKKDSWKRDRKKIRKQKEKSWTD